jgi:hypothetical protein
MIMPCMNSTFFAELGGSVALVEAGKVFVGWPGAPGCTITGGAESGSCAPIGSERKHTIVPAASSPPNLIMAPFPEPNVCFKRKDFIRKKVKLETQTLSQSGTQNHLSARRPLGEILGTFVDANVVRYSRLPGCSRVIKSQCSLIKHQS